MRILNRPMFRYGGPIKEGVMHGMRNGGRTLAGGNQIGTPMGNRTGFKNPLSWKSQIATKIPAVGNIYKKGLANWGNILNKAKGMFGTTTPVRHIPVTRVPGGTVKNTWGINTTTKPSWKAGKEVTENIWSPNYLGKTSEFQLGKKIWEGRGFLGKPIKAGAQFLYRTPTASIPLVYFGGKWLLKDGTPAPDQDKINQQVAGDAQGWDPGAGGEQYTDPNVAKKLAWEKQNERLQSYLNMMGYDSAKKGALDKALIDASALVQDATTEAGSLKHADWGNLINRAIQTTSKRLEKPEQIREAVGLMMTKGEIEKDIAEGKGSALDIQEKYYTGKLGKAGAERKMLNKPTSLAEAVNNTKATDSKGDRTGQALRNYYDGHLVPSFKSKLSKDKIKDLGGEDIFKQDATIALGDGVYQVSNSYIIVQGNKIIKLADVFESED